MCGSDADNLVAFAGYIGEKGSEAVRITKNPVTVGAFKERHFNGIAMSIEIGEEVEGVEAALVEVGTAVPVIIPGFGSGAACDFVEGKSEMAGFVAVALHGVVLLSWFMP